MMRKHIAIGVALVMLGGLVIAQEIALRSAPAQRAMQRHAQAVKRAEQEYQRAMADANNALIRDLEEAKAQAMKAGQLEEANAVQAAIDQAKSPTAAVRQKGDLAGSKWLRVSNDSGGVATIAFEPDGSINAPGTAWTRWEARGDALRIRGKDVRAFTAREATIYITEDAGVPFILIPAEP